MDKNLQFIQNGKTGCVFATILSRDPEKIGWVRQVNPQRLIIPKDAYILSLVFPNKTMEETKQWALENGMYEDITSKATTGLRVKIGKKVSWVQYFGPESHAPTRQTPYSELLFCTKLPAKYYHKVGFAGVLHLAHANISYLDQSKLDKIWTACFVNTKKILRHEPTIAEAAKTTFKIK